MKKLLTISLFLLNFIGYSQPVNVVYSIPTDVNICGFEVLNIDFTAHTITCNVYGPCDWPDIYSIDLWFEDYATPGQPIYPYPCNYASVILPPNPFSSYGNSITFQFETSCDYELAFEHNQLYHLTGIIAANGSPGTSFFSSCLTVGPGGVLGEPFSLGFFEINLSEIISYECSLGGCTKTAALNYNSYAFIDDGSCIYPECNCENTYPLDINNNSIVDLADFLNVLSLLGCNLETGECIDTNYNIDLNWNLMEIIDAVSSSPLDPNRKISKVIDITGREVHPGSKGILLFIYDDGSVEKKINKF